MTNVPSTRRARTMAGWLAIAALLPPSLPWAADGAVQGSPSARVAADQAQGAMSSKAVPPAGREPGQPDSTRAGTAHRPVKLTTKARRHFVAAWGVDGLRISRVASGNLIRFTYRVTEPVQAAPLVDRSATPVLYAPRSRAVLSVPVMEKIGALRQVGTLNAGQEYWVAFSNKGNLVKSGDRVDVIIGNFHANGLLVE